MQSVVENQESGISTSPRLHGPVSGFWLFSKNLDLSAFLGSALASIFLLFIGSYLGILNEETPEWTWIVAVLMIDVAHVWSSSFRVYFDIDEFKSKPLLYLAVPLGGYLIGMAVYSEYGALTFWRILALIAVFHFVRQQYGWVRLYRAKLGEENRITNWIDTFAIYLATIYPLAFWMASLPRNFQWFVQDDFIALPALIEKILFPLYCLSLAAYAAKSIYLYATQKFLNPGKDIVVATTAICWYLGIVYFNSDYAFTVTNVVIHGIPYFVLVYWYAKMRRETASGFYKFLSGNWLVFLATLWALAYIEELFWHKGIWHEKDWLFGADWELGEMKTYIVPLLALPQVTHYVLDGFIWRRKYNPSFKLVLKEKTAGN